MKKMLSVSGSTAKKLRANTSFEFSLSFSENKRRIISGINIWLNREDINQYLLFASIKIIALLMDRF
jgi:hypothetical protein